MATTYLTSFVAASFVDVSLSTLLSFIHMDFDFFFPNCLFAPPSIEIWLNALGLAFDGISRYGHVLPRGFFRVVLCNVQGMRGVFNGGVLHAMNVITTYKPLKIQLPCYLVFLNHVLEDTALDRPTFVLGHFNVHMFD
jgi:hypothetical protein